MIAMKKIRESINTLSDQDRNYTAKIAELQEKRKELETLPIPKRDLVQYFCECIDELATEYPRRLQHLVNNQLERPQTAYRVLPLRKLLSPHDGTDGTKVTAGALCYLLRDQLKDGIAKAVDDIEFPKAVGPIRSERGKQIAKLDKEISNYQAKQAELRSQASSAGIQLG